MLGPNCWVKKSVLWVTMNGHAIGQKSSVFVQRLIMRHTVEEKMMVLKEQKRALFSAVLERSDAASVEGAASLTAADFRFLVDS